MSKFVVTAAFKVNASANRWGGGVSAEDVRAEAERLLVRVVDANRYQGAESVTVTSVTEAEEEITLTRSELDAMIREACEAAAATATTPASA